MQELRLPDLPKAHQFGVRHKRPHRAARAGAVFAYISAQRKSRQGFPRRPFVVALLLLKVCFAERCSNVSLLSHRTHSLHCEAVDASQAKARLDQAKAETDAKVKALQDQAKTASNMAKARIDRRIAAAKADFEVRSKKLSQAWTLTKEALAA